MLPRYCEASVEAWAPSRNVLGEHVGTQFGAGRAVCSTGTVSTRVRRGHDRSDPVCVCMRVVRAARLTAFVVGFIYTDRSPPNSSHSEAVLIAKTLSILHNSQFDAYTEGR